MFTFKYEISFYFFVVLCFELFNEVKTVEWGVECTTRKNWEKVLVSIDYLEDG